MNKKEIIIDMCKKLEKETEEDAKDFNNAEFNARNVGTQFGLILAEINTLALALRMHLEDSNDD